MKKPNFNFDLASVKGQFSGLKGKHPGLWPGLPKSLLLFGIFLALLTAVYFGYVNGQREELERLEATEVSLKNEYKDKIKKAVNLEALKGQKEEVSQYVQALEKQLPSRSEMDALLSDINQAGVGRGLQFELFAPGTHQVKDYYAELPIKVKVLGQYHDIGSFTSDISNLPRIVTLNNLLVKAVDGKGGNILSMEATAKTYRYLDAEEVAAVRREAQKKAQAAGGKK
jgi:type IV pilus assembly protein PilO